MKMHNQASYWDKRAGIYEHRYGYDTESGKAKLLSKVDALVKAGHLDNKSIVLELGCGTGAFTREITRRSRWVTAVDVSPKMLDAARLRSWRYNNWNSDYKLCDFHDLSPLLLTPGRFDCVIGVYSLMYADVRKVLGECYRALRRGGRLAIIEINGLNPVAALRMSWIGKRLLGVSQEAQAHTPGWWSNMLSSRFTEIEITPIVYPAKILKPLGGSLVIGATKP